MNIPPKAELMPVRKYFSARDAYARTHGFVSADEFKAMGQRGDLKYIDAAHAFNRANREWIDAVIAWRERNPELHAWNERMKAARREARRGFLGLSMAPDLGPARRFPTVLDAYKHLHGPVSANEFREMARRDDPKYREAARMFNESFDARGKKE